MNVWLERVAFLQILNCDSATKFDAGGRSAQTFPFAHVNVARFCHTFLSIKCAQNIISLY